MARWFHRLPPLVAGCGFEAALLLLAALGAALLERPLWSQFAGTGRDLWIGTVATVPALAAFYLAQRSTWPPLARLREVLDEVLPQWFAGCSWPQLALLSVLAGVGEEALFRGLLQGWLTDTLGVGLGLLLASVAFGLCHALTPAYAVAATLMGAYLGGLYLWSGSLLAPALTHALYDFAALLWLLRPR